MVSVSLEWSPLIHSFKPPSIYFYAVPVYKGCPSHFRCLSHLMVPHVLLDLSCLLLSALLVSFPFFYYYFRISVILCPNSYTYLISCSITSTSFSCIPFIFQIYIFISFSLFRLFACIVTYLFPCSFRQFSISDGIQFLWTSPLIYSILILTVYHQFLITNFHRPFFTSSYPHSAFNDMLYLLFQFWQFLNSFHTVSRQTFTRYNLYPQYEYIILSS